MTFISLLSRKLNPNYPSYFGGFQKAVMPSLSSLSPRASGKGLFAVIILVDPFSPYLTRLCSVLPTCPIPALELDHGALNQSKKTVSK